MNCILEKLPEMLALLGAVCGSAPFRLLSAHVSSRNHDADNCHDSEEDHEKSRPDQTALPALQVVPALREVGDAAAEDELGREVDGGQKAAGEPWPRPFTA